MRAVGYQTSLPISNPASLSDIELDRPVASGRDLLVEVRAISVNPVDTKMRKRAAAEQGGWRVLGWDAAGVVIEAGSQASRFKPGDEIFYAGARDRPGTNAELHLVDERIVGRKPRSLSFEAAAALPLTSVTAWETLFDRLDIRKPVPSAAAAVLVIGGAGGVGSIAIQLIRNLTDCIVIATASRPETREWSRRLGAQHVVDHSADLAKQVAALGIGAPAFVFSTTHTDQHLAQIAALIAPQGRLALIDDPASFEIGLLKSKSISIHWEFMFTRSMFETSDMDAQGRVLDEVSRLVDDGTLQSTLSENFGPISAENLRRAHALIESNRAKGKIVLSGW